MSDLLASANARRTAGRCDSSVPHALPHFDTLLMVIVAGAVLTVVRVDAAWNPTPMLVRIACEYLAGMGLWMLVRKYPVIRDRGWQYVTAGVLTATLYPLAFEYGSRKFGSGSEPFEMLLLTSLQLSAMVLAAFSFMPRLSGTSVLLSSFLLLFATIMTTSPLALVLACIYGVLGLWWLMGAYWERIEGAFVASSVERSTPVRVSTIGTTGLVLLLLAGFLGATSTSAVALRGFMPTSGGNRWHDLHARSGVGDGDAMVAAKENAVSFGPVESELFLDSDMPSLYDMLDDTYGEPTKRQKEQQKAIGLTSQEREQSEQRTAKSERSGREFSTVRRRVQRQRTDVADREAPAILYVVGQTPLHLGLETYDFFDGQEWEHRVAWKEPSDLVLNERLGKPWIGLRLRNGSVIGRGDHQHALKIINLQTNRIPAPPNLADIHIDMVDRVDFFDWTEDGMVEMSDREHIPQLTVIHLHSFGLNLFSLRRRDRDFSTSYGQNAARLAPYRERSGGELERTAAAWVSNVPRGWLQVETVVDRLRRDFTLDPDSPAPGDCPDAVAHFLEAGRGPDYLFATTAAMMLRSLDYPTRLVSGFYVRPERYDRRAGQTSVLAEDVHVWAEVCVDGRNWVTIEPTPGYQPPRESLTWQQWALLAYWRGVAWCGRNSLVLFLVVAVMAALFAARRVWLDWIGVVVCSVLGLRSTKARLVWTIRLLEWRAWLIGRRRPPQRTIVAWYSPLSRTTPLELQPLLRRFFHWTDCLLYSPQAIQAKNYSEIRRACQVLMVASTRRSMQSCLPFTASHSA